MRSLEGGLKIVWYVILLAPLLRKLVIGFWSGFSLRCRSASASKWTRFELSLLHSVILPLDSTKKVHCKEFNCVWLIFFNLFLNFNWLLEHLLCHLTYFFIFLLQMPDVGPVYSQSHSGSRRSNVIPGLLQRQSGLWPCQVHILLLKLLFDMKNIWGFFFLQMVQQCFIRDKKMYLVLFCAAFLLQSYLRLWSEWLWTALPCCCPWRAPWCVWITCGAWVVASDLSNISSRRYDQPSNWLVVLLMIHSHSLHNRRQKSPHLSIKMH